MKLKTLRQNAAVLAFGSATLLAFGALPVAAQSDFRLQILHASDLEGGIAALDDAPRFSAVLNALKPTHPNTLVLSSGDNYIPGPFFSASGDPSLRAVLGREDKGRGDIVMMNAMGFQASALGNHEFDDGTPRVAALVAPDRAYPGTNFPYLSTNLDFSGDSNLAGLVVAGGQEAATVKNKIAKSTVITVNGEKIGIVGATTPQLPRLSSIGGVRVFPANENDFDSLAAIIQSEVDALTGTGLDKIIVLAHMQQLEIERTLATKLRDVDVIVAGGSNTLLADGTDRLRAGDSAQGPYPILLKDAQNRDVAVVNTDGNYKYVGRLVLSFDASGRIVPSSIDADESGVFATDAQGVSALGNPAPVPKVVEVTDALRAVIVAKDGALFGKTAVYLNGLRGSVRTQETNLGNISADANLFIARQSDPTTTISLKNGGGIRDSIGAIDPPTGELIPPLANPIAGKESGDVSQLDIENSLRFNNTLSLLTLTARQLLQVAEYGVADSGPGRTPGRFPQIAGFSFTYDLRRPSGSRIQTLVVGEGRNQQTVVRGGRFVGSESRTFRMVTLSFLAGGGDGYPFAAFQSENPTLFNRVDLVSGGTTVTFSTDGAEQKALADYLVNFHSNAPYNGTDTPIRLDRRIRLATSSPLVTVASPAQRSIVGALGSITGNAQDMSGTGLARVSLRLIRNADRRYWNGQTWLQTPTELPTTLQGTPSEALWTGSFANPSGADLSSGLYEILATATDNADQSSTTRRSFFVDADAPRASVTSPANRSTVRSLSEIRGAASDNYGPVSSGISAVQITLRNSEGFFWNGAQFVEERTTLPTRLIGSRGPINWVYRDALPQENDEYFVGVAVFDGVGNSSQTTSSFRLFRSNRRF